MISMSIEQAIKKISSSRIQIDNPCESAEIESAISIAIDAMQKQIESKPIKTYVHGVIGTMYRCRKCHRLLKPYENAYCDCGQKVGWDFDE